MRRSAIHLGIAAAFTFGATVIGTGQAFAYGHADSPVAQIEISLNCNNTTVCPQITGGSEGGFWIWAELDNNTGADGWAGTTDFTFAGCGHTVGSHGSGNQGGGGYSGSGTWQKYGSILDVLGAFDYDFTNLFPVAVALTPDGQYIDTTVPYYVFGIEDPHFGTTTYYAVPAVQGHYSISGLQIVTGQDDPLSVQDIITAPGITAQTQVAP